MLRKAKIDVFKWVAILPALAGLIGEVVEALSDKRIDEQELKKIGSDLVALVAAVL